MWISELPEGTRSPIRRSGLTLGLRRVISLALALSILLAGGLLPLLWEESVGWTPRMPGAVVEPIYDFSLSEGENRILLTARNQVLVRDSRTGEILFQRPLDRDFQWEAAWIPGSSAFFLSDSRGRLLKFDGGDSWKSRSVPHPHREYILSFAFTKDGRRAVTGSADCLCLWNLPEEKIVAQISMHGTAPKSVQFSARQDRLLVGCDDGSVRVYDAKDLSRKHRFQTTGQSVTQVQFLDRGRKILGRTLWGPAFVLDASTGETVWKRHSPKLNFVGLAVSPDEKTFAISDSRNAISLYSAASFETIKTLHGHDRLVIALQFSQETGWLYSAGHDGTIRIWDTHTFTEMGCYQATSPQPNEESSNKRSF